MKAEILFPEVANLYGDLQNIEYLRRSCASLTVKETSLKEKPGFLTEETALVYMGSITERGQELARDALLPYREEIRQKTEAGQLFLLTGNAMDVFGEEIVSDGGAARKMLGLLPLRARYTMMKRYNALFLGKFGETDIVGFKSLFGFTEGSVPPLFRTVRGCGRSPETPEEGVRVHRFFATHLTGPLLLLNPPFTKYLLREMGESEPHLAFEAEAEELYRRRVQEFSDPATGVEYH